VKYTSKNFLYSLFRVRWKTAFQTYGNDHSTLIGLIVDWWNNLSSKNFVLESRPSFGRAKRKEGKGRGNCDAILGTNNDPIGVLEVEGPRKEKWKWCIQKFENFFREFKTLEFAILFVYPYEPRGRGNNRKVDLDKPTIKKLLLNLSHKYPKTGVVLLILDKKFERKLKGIRTRNPYYQCTPMSVERLLFVNGKEQNEKLTFGKN